MMVVGVIYSMGSDHQAPDHMSNRFGAMSRQLLVEKNKTKVSAHGWRDYVHVPRD